MEDRIVLTIEKLRELCPKCADKMANEHLAKGMKVKKVSIKKTDYDWFMLKNDRPPKEWWDSCIEGVTRSGGADDPAAVCGAAWYDRKGSDEECAIPDTEDAVDAIKEKMKADECIGKLKKNVETVMCWRKFGKPLSKEQQAFADRVADDMIALRVSKQVGIQLISGSNIRFIKKGQPVLGSDAVAGIAQDVVSNVQRKSGKFPRKTKEEDEDVEKIAKPASDPSSKEKIPASTSESGQLPKKTPDIENIKLSPPEEHKEGEVTDTIAEEKIGHQPNLPLPKKMAEELIRNAQWGVEIGAYTNVKEGIERQLGRKAYEEFVDTDDKLKAVISYLGSLNEE